MNIKTESRNPPFTYNLPVNSILGVQVIIVKGGFVDFFVTKRRMEIWDYYMGLAKLLL